MFFDQGNQKAVAVSRVFAGGSPRKLQESLGQKLRNFHKQKTAIHEKTPSTMSKTALKLRWTLPQTLSPSSETGILVRDTTTALVSSFEI